MKYIDLTLMKAILGIDGSALDGLIDFYIESASDVVANYIGRNIAETSYVQKLKANDKNVLWLDYKPVSSITSVTLNGVDITSDVEVVEENNGLYYANGFAKNYDYITKTSTYSDEYYAKKESTYNVEIDGTFGYATIPSDIQNVVSNIVQNNFVKSGICPQTKKESLETDFGKNSKEYFDIINKVDLSDEDKSTLNKYR